MATSRMRSRVPEPSGHLRRHGRADARDLARHARQPDRQHRAADDRRRPGRARPPLLGGHGVRAGDRCRDPGLGQARRSLRPQGHVHGLDRDLPARVGARRDVAEHGPAHRLPRVPGARRRRPVRGRHGDHRRPGPAARARPLPGADRRHDAHRLHRRPTARRRVQARIDYAGAALLTVGIVALTLVASWGGSEYPWGSWQILGLAAVSGASLVAFVLAERRAAEPIIPPRLFRNRDFTVAQVLSFLVGAAMFGSVNLLPQYMQYVRGASSTASGLLLLPLMFGMLVVMLATGQITTRTGHYRSFPILGGAFMTAGMLVLLLLGVDTTTLLITQNSVEQRDLGAASGSVTLFRTVGGSLGIALLGSVYANRLQETLAARLGAPGKALVSGGARIPPAVLHRMPAQIRDAFDAAVVHGLHGALLGGALMAFAGFLVAWYVREAPLRGWETEASARAPAPATPSETHSLARGDG